MATITARLVCRDIAVTTSKSTRSVADFIVSSNLMRRSDHQGV
jgi:hypothetical protein